MVSPTTRTVHHGPCTTLGQAYNALLVWVEANYYRAIGSLREVYLPFDR